MLEKDLNSTAKIILISVVFFSCNSDPRDWSRSRPEEGSGILERSVFIEVMTDVYLVEAAYKSNVQTREVELEKLEVRYGNIYASHGITQEEFEKSHKWWWEHPAAMKGVLQEVTENIISIEKSLSNHKDSK